MKVMYVERDIAKEGLGLSTENRGLVLASHDSLVFQTAASVSFQDTSLVNVKMKALPLMWL
jgi:hypothetical protein